MLRLIAPPGLFPSICLKGLRRNFPGEEAERLSKGSRDPLFRKKSKRYDSSNRITQAQDNIGRAVSYSYDSSGRLFTVTDAKGGTTNYTYNSNSNMLMITGPRGLTSVDSMPETELPEQVRSH